MERYTYHYAGDDRYDVVDTEERTVLTAADAAGRLNELTAENTRLKAQLAACRTAAALELPLKESTAVDALKARVAELEAAVHDMVHYHATDWRFDTAGNKVEAACDCPGCVKARAALTPTQEAQDEQG